MKQYSDNPKSIKYHVKKYLLKNKKQYFEKTIVDLPAGNGVTSKLLLEMGANPIPFDLFPEYFTDNRIECKRVDITEGIPMENKIADFAICQEGIEHFTDQFNALKEFNRILKQNGSLIITTPNYSNLRARLSYFLCESERFCSMMPPNEIDSIWMNNEQVSDKIYFGHVFLLGIQKLRVMARLAGFKIKYIQPTRLKTTSLIILIFTYPFIFISNYISYLKNINKDKGYDKKYQKEVYKEIFKLSINFRLLVDSHLFVVFEKEKDSENVFKELKSVHKEFGLT